jgi:hypothetical protein
MGNKYTVPGIPATGIGFGGTGAVYSQGHSFMIYENKD